MMKCTKIIFLMALIFLSESTIAEEYVATKLAMEQEKVGVATFTSPDYKPGIIRHIVLFKYRDTVSVEQQGEIRSRFMNLGKESKWRGKSYIKSIETGDQISGEGADRGIQQAFIVTFSSEGARNYYVGSPVVKDSNYYDPAHESFKKFVAPFLSEAIVIDYRVIKK
jgi:hypothetical protein